MKVTLIGSATGGRTDGSQFLMSILVNDTVAIDAGCIGFLSPVRLQGLIQHIFLSHSHLDHIVSLPILLDNVYQPTDECPTVYAAASILADLKNYFLNDAVWPDLFRIAALEGPFLRTVELEHGQAVEADGLQVTPIPLQHTVPTSGFLIEDASSAIAVVSDTSPTEQTWERINQLENLKAVFLEASFPNAEEALAVKSQHLTPRMLQAELAKLNRDVPIVVVHIKAPFRNQVEQELRALRNPRIHIGQPDSPYFF